MQNRSLRGSASFALFLLAALALLAGGYTITRQMSSRGVTFFERGKSIATALDRFARAAKARDVQAVAAFIAPEYRGQTLGLACLRLLQEKDGVRRSAMTPDG